MKHLKAFEDALGEIHGEGRYRVFIDLQRQRGKFPKAIARFEDGEREVTIWCSNDYLGMGQDEDVISAMHTAIGDGPFAADRGDAGGRFGPGGLAGSAACFVNSGSDL